MSFCVRSITWKKATFWTDSTGESKTWPRLQDVQGREANDALLNGNIYSWHRVRAPTLPVHQHWHNLFYCTWQILLFLRTEDFRQPCLKHIYSATFSNSISHFMSLCHILVILTFQTFWLLLYLLRWSEISELCCYYYDSLKAKIMVSIFQQCSVLKFKYKHFFRHTATAYWIQYNINLTFICTERPQIHVAHFTVVLLD